MQTGSHTERIFVGTINSSCLFVVQWVDLILALLCCVPGAGVHSLSNRMQSAWAGYSDCHNLSRLTSQRCP